METPSRAAAPGPHRSFLNFLRGMETGPVPYPAGRDGPFLNFLRGMETAERRRRPAAKRSFLNFLRGMETRRMSALRGAREGLPKLP